MSRIAVIPFKDKKGTLQVDYGIDLDTLENVVLPLLKTYANFVRHNCYYDPVLAYYIIRNRGIPQ